MTAPATRIAAPVRLRVAAVTPGRDVPSARFRVRQLIPALGRSGVDVHELVPRLSAYPPAARWARPFWGAAALAERVPLAAATHGYDMTLLQREMISTLATLERFTRSPRVLDVDDAIFLGRGGPAAERLARLCASVVCGNAFLAEHFSHWNRNVAIVPTAVDTNRFAPLREPRDERDEIIGWIGTRGNLGSLESLEEALAAAFAIRPRARLRVVCDAPPRFRALAPDRVDFRPWSRDAEPAELAGMSLGVMPLEDSPWARGKCSFKMLMYMACGLPVVVSPVGTNAEVLALGPSGLAATTTGQWSNALAGLLGDADARNAMGKAGRRVVEAHFSVEVIAPRLAGHLRSLGEGSVPAWE